MKNIAIFIPTVESGGAEKQALLLAETLVNNATIYFIYFHESLNHDSKNYKIINSMRDNVEFYSPKGGYILKLFKIFIFIKCKKIDCIFNYMTFCNFFGSFFSKILGVKKICNGIRNSKLPIHKLIFDIIAHELFSTYTIVNSHSGKIIFNNYLINKKKLIVINNCYNDISQPYERPEKVKKIIITVGRFVKQKDFKTALLTIRQLAVIRSDFKYLIIGYGPMEFEIRTLIDDLKLNDLVEIILNPENVISYLKSADIYLSTSLFEGTSNSIMEAMDASLPIVATFAGDNDKLVNDNQNGFLHNQRDFISISNSLDKLLGDCKLRNQFGFKSNLHLQKNYHSKIFKNKYLKLIYE